MPTATRLVRLMRPFGDYVDLAWTWMIRSLKAHAPLAKGRLLDVGCGDLPYRELFLPHVTEYVGIEHEGSFTLTSASGQSRKPDHLYDGVRLPFDDASFDTVMNIQVLEHTPEPARLIRELARVLKPDGVLLLCAPFSFRVHEEPHDYFRYTPYGLRHLCSQAGLEITSTQAQGGLWGLLSHKVNSYLSFRVLRVGALGVAVGKLGHESTEQPGVRWWLVPLVGPLLFVVAFLGRTMDRLMPEPTETLSYFIVATKR